MSNTARRSGIADSRAGSRDACSTTVPTRLAVVPIHATLLLDRGKRWPEAGEFAQRHLLGVRQNPTPADQASEIAVQPSDCVFREPMQSRRREHSVHLWLGNSIDPRRVVQVSAHDPHAVVVGKRRRREGEQHRIDIHSDRARLGQPIE